MVAPNKTRADRLDMGDEYQKAEYALQARRYDLALQIAHKALSEHPENSLAFVIIARAYVYKKNPPEAMRAIREALRLNPDNSYAHMLYGVLLRDALKYREAEQELLAALQLNPFDHNAHYFYASFLLSQKKDVRGARLHATKALELVPDDARYHVMFGAVLAQEGKSDEAEQEYRRALSLDPDNPAILNSYGSYLLQRKADPEQALEFFRQALMRNPDDDSIRRNFLVALHGRHKVYSLFWKYSLLMRKMGRWRWLAFVAVFAVMYLIELAQYYVPPLAPICSVVIWLPGVLIIYLWIVDHIFRYLSRRGLIWQASGVWNRHS